MVLFFKRIFIQQVLVAFAGPVIVSFAMYLMIEHNNKDYIKFLKVIRCLRLHWICLCWRNLVIQQIEQYENENNKNMPQINKRITPLTTTVNVIPMQKSTSIEQSETSTVNI